MSPYQTPPNRFRRDLLAGKQLTGCWCSLANPITTEILGIAGFDWLLLAQTYPLPDSVTRKPPRGFAMTFDHGIGGTLCGCTT